MAQKRPAASCGPSKKRHHDDKEERCADLLSLGRASYVSQSGITSLLKSIEKEGLPEAFSRKTQYRQRKAKCALETNALGPLVVQQSFTVAHKIDGKEVKSCVSVGMQNPLAFLYYHCMNSPHFTMLVREGLARKPCSPSDPWRIALYLDGVNPSDGLTKSATRKFTIYYWSLIELGVSALAHEECWATIAAVKDNMVAKLRGGVPELTTRVLEQFFGTTNNAMIAGVTVQLGPEEDAPRVKLWLVVGLLLADEPAEKELLACKGHAGIKPCWKCMNCVSKSSEENNSLSGQSDYCIPIGETDLSKFKQHTDASLRLSVQRLHAYKSTLNNEEFKLREMLYGWNYNPWSVVLNTRFRLNVVSIGMTDWGHTYASDGLADTEWGTFVKKASKDGLASYPEFAEYALQFQPPQSRGMPTHLFDEKRYKNYMRTGSFPAIASEFLTLAPIMRRYLSHVVAQRGNPEYVQSMQAVLDVVDLLQACKVGVVSPVVLGNAIKRHLELYKQAYGEEQMRPKHHYSIHLPTILARFGFLLATWTHERKHRMAKRYSKNRCKASSWATGVIEDITMHQIWELQMPFFEAFSTSLPKRKILNALHELFPSIRDCDFTLHPDVTINGGKVKPNDVVCFKWQGDLAVGRLLMTVGIQRPKTSDKLLFSLVSMWEETRDSGRDNPELSMRTFRVTDRSRKTRTSSLDTVLTHRMSSDGSVCDVFLPYELRPL